MGEDIFLPEGTREFLRELTKEITRSIDETHAMPNHMWSCGPGGDLLSLKFDEVYLDELQNLSDNLKDTEKIIRIIPIHPGKYLVVWYQVVKDNE